MRIRPLVVLTVIVAGSLLSGCGGGDGGVLRTGGSVVLVGAAGDRRNIPEAVLTGPLTMAGDCLGINGATVIWPHGTKIATDDPLTIDVPSLGRLRVGDYVDGMGGDEYVDYLPKGIDAVPSGCPTDQVVAFYPDQKPSGI
jgi:hypothetical protein